MQQLLALLHGLAGAHLRHTQFHFAEGVEVDLFLVVGDLGHGFGLGGFRLGSLGGLGFGSGLALGVLRFQISDLRLHVDAGEQGVALVHGVGAAQAAHGLVAQQGVQLVGAHAQLFGHLGGGVGQVGLQQGSHQFQGAAQVEEHRVQAGMIGLVLGQHPGRGLVDVLVGALHQLKDVDQGGGHVQGFHGSVHLAGQFGHHGGQGLVDGGVGHGAAEVLFAHGHGAGQ